MGWHGWDGMDGMAPSIIRAYHDRDFDDYAETLLGTLPCEDIGEARENVVIALGRTKEKGEELWVAEVDGRAVGFMLLEFTRIWGHERGEAFEVEAVCIDWLDVHTGFQRKGIGRELLRWAEARAAERGLHRIFAHTAVTNLPMVNFASKNGFRFEKYLEEFWGKGTGDAFLLVKEL